MRSAHALPIAVVLSLAACGGSPGLRGNEYRDGEAHYRIGSLSQDWSRVGVEGQNDVAFHHERLGALVQINATCDPGADVPLTALTNHLLFGFTERNIESQRLVPLDAREALRTHVTARLDGVARELLFYVMKKDDCVYDFALIAPGGDGFGEALREFEPFVAAFSTEGS